MASEEHFLLTDLTDNSSVVRTHPYSPFCYELKLVPPVLHQSHLLRLEFTNFYVHEISVRGIFVRDNETISYSLVNSYYLMSNCHTEQNSHDRFDISIQLPESSANLSQLQIFCYQPSINWCRWRLDSIKLFSITELVPCVTNETVSDTSNTVKLIKSLTSVLQENIISSKRNDSLEINSKLTPRITGPYYNIQLLLCNQ